MDGRNTCVAAFAVLICCITVATSSAVNSEASTLTGSKAPGVPEAGKSALPQRGHKELANLRLAVANAKELLQAAQKSGSDEDAAKARGALLMVRSLTVQLETAIGQPKAGPALVDGAGDVDPMARVRVETHPESTKNEYPALGLTLDTASADGADAPASNTLEVWGRQVANERDQVQKEGDAVTQGIVDRFSDLGKILSKRGNGKGFGKIHTRPTSAEKTPSDAESKLSATINKAESLLRQSKETLGVVTSAVNDVVQLSAEDERAKRSAMHKEKEANDEDVRSMWENIRQMNVNFAQNKLDPKEAKLEVESEEEHEKDEANEESIDAENDADRAKALDSKLDIIAQKQEEAKRAADLQKHQVDADAATEASRANAHEQEQVQQAKEQVRQQQKVTAKMQVAKQEARRTADKAGRKRTEEIAAEAQSELDKAHTIHELEKTKKDTMSMDERNARRDASEDAEAKIEQLFNDEHKAPEEGVENGDDQLSKDPKIDRGVAAEADSPSVDPEDEANMHGVGDRSQQAP